MDRASIFYPDRAGAPRKTKPNIYTFLRCVKSCYVTLSDLVGRLVSALHVNSLYNHYFPPYASASKLAENQMYMKKRKINHTI
jgi:hypothetical protein